MKAILVCAAAMAMSWPWLGEWSGAWGGNSSDVLAACLPAPVALMMLAWTLVLVDRRWFRRRM